MAESVRLNDGLGRATNESDGLDAAACVMCRAGRAYDTYHTGMQYGAWGDDAKRGLSLSKVVTTSLEGLVAARSMTPHAGDTKAKRGLVAVTLGFARDVTRQVYHAWFPQECDTGMRHSRSVTPGFPRSVTQQV